MNVTEVLSTARDSITVKRVFGDPYEKDGLTVIPATDDGGTGHDGKGQEGEGGGFGVTGRPAGAFVINNGQVSWRPAVDANRIITVVGIVIAAFLLGRRRRRVGG